MSTITTAMFTKMNNNTVMVAEASTLGWRPLWSPMFLTVKSEWTDRSITVERTKTKRNDEGEPMAWVYTPSDKSIPLKIEVYND